MTVKQIEEGNKSNADEGEKTNAAGKITVGETEYSAEDIQNLVKQQAAATQKTQEVAAVLAAAEKYGVDPETYIAQAEGAFGVMSQLITDKVIDEKGNIIKAQVPGNEDKTGDEGELAKLLGLAGGAPKSVAGADKIAAIVAKALEPQLEGMKKLGERVAAVDKTQGDMIRLNLEEKVMSKFPNLKSNEVAQVFGRAMEDRSKSLWEHAEDVSKAKATDISSLREAHAKEFGIDLTKFDENKLNEQEAGGGAGVLFAKKKFKFDARSGDEDAISPAKAAREYIERLSSKG